MLKAAIALIVVWMTVAPIPVVPLHSVVLPVVLTITPVLFHQIMSVGAIFVSVPVVIVMMVSVVDSHLDFLSFGFNHNEDWCNNGSQE